MAFLWSQDKYEKPAAFKTQPENLKRINIKVRENFEAHCQVGKGVSQQQIAKLQEIVTESMALFDCKKIGSVKTDPIEIVLKEGCTIDHIPHIKNPTYSYVSSKSFLSNLLPYITAGVVRDCTHRSGLKSTLRAYFLPKPPQYDSNNIKTQKFRLICDLRALNSVTKSCVLPTPSYIEICSNLARASVISSVDLASAYNLLKLSTKAADMIVFPGPNCQRYQLLRLPQGMKSSSSALVRKILETSAKCVFKHGTLVTTYADDLLITTPGDKTIDDHLEDLQAFFRKFSEAGWQINLEKVQLLLSRKDNCGIVFLGRNYNIKDEEMGTTCRAPNKHIQALRELQPPRTVGEARSFLASTQYHSGFVYKYSDHTARMRKEVRRINATPTEKFTITPEMIRDFTHIIAEIANTQTHTLPDTDPTTFKLQVYTDASIKATAAIMFLVMNDKPDQPYLIACTSKSFDEAKSRSASIHNLEMLAVIEAFREFHEYFKCGATTEFFIDSKPLVDIAKTKNYNTIVSKSLSIKFDYYINCLANGNIDFKYVKTDKNVSDYLTRLGYKNKPEEIKTRNGEYYLDSQFENSDFDNIKITNTHTIPTSDKQIKELTDALNDDIDSSIRTVTFRKKDTWDDIVRAVTRSKQDLTGTSIHEVIEGRHENSETKQDSDTDSEVSVDSDNSISDEDRTSPQPELSADIDICHPPDIPNSRKRPENKVMLDQKQLLRLHVFLNHASTNRMKDYLKENKEMKARACDLDKIHEKCLSCTTVPNKLGQIGKRSPFSQAIAVFPLHIVSADIGYVGLTDDLHGNSCFIIFVDNFSNFAVCYPMKSESQTDAIKALQKFIQHYGIMNTLITDNGACFTSHLFKRYLHERCIKIQYTSVQQHQSNKAEQLMLPVRAAVKKKILDLRVLNKDELTTITNPFLGAKTKNKKRDKPIGWGDVIPEVLGAHNHIPRRYETPDEVKLYSPSQIFFNSTYRPFVSKPIVMRESHAISEKPIDQDHVLKSKLYKLSDKPKETPEKFTFIPGDICVLMTLNTTKNTKSFRSHELLQVTHVAGATALVRAYRRPFKEQPSFSVHANLLRKVDIYNMILNGESLHEAEPIRNFSEKQSAAIDFKENITTVY